MPVSTVNTLNQVQKIPETALNERVVLQPNTYYTCPSGKKARVSGTITCTGRGAAAEAYLRDPSDSFNYAKWVVTGSAVDVEGTRVLRVDQALTFDFELDAGDVIKTTQDAGTNAEFNVNLKILELPA